MKIYGKPHFSVQQGWKTIFVHVKNYETQYFSFEKLFSFRATMDNLFFHVKRTLTMKNAIKSIKISQRQYFSLRSYRSY